MFHSRVFHTFTLGAHTRWMKKVINHTKKNKASLDKKQK